jgi:hypothetical protein
MVREEPGQTLGDGVGCEYPVWTAKMETPSHTRYSAFAENLPSVSVVVITKSYPRILPILTVHQQFRLGSGKR